MKWNRFFCIILALVLVLSAVPMYAAAKTVKITGYDTGNHIQQEDGSYMSQFIFADGSQVHTLYGEVVQSSNKNYKVGDVVGNYSGKDNYIFNRHFHEFDYTVTRNGHGLGCSCGAKHGFIPHDDPKTAVDGKCTCGYEYYHNAQITVIWMSDVKLTPTFYKDKYEYTGKLLRDVDEISTVTVKLFDEKATLEQPESFKLKKGTNVFEFTVTAEDSKTTQTYKITIEK